MPAILLKSVPNLLEVHRTPRNFVEILVSLLKLPCEVSGPAGKYFKHLGSSNNFHKVYYAFMKAVT